MKIMDGTQSGIAGKMSTLRGVRFSTMIRLALLFLLLFFIYKNWHKDEPLGQLLERYAYPDSKFVDVEGLRVHYRDVGRGEVLVLLHDANNAVQTWDAWVDSLSATYRVIAVDLPGFGLTGPHPQGSYSTFMYVNFLEQFTEVIQVRKFTLIGNGMGGQVAWFYATEHPNRLNRLVLLSPTGFEKPGYSLVTLLAKTPVINRVLWSITPRNAVQLMLEDMYADDARIDRALVDRYMDLLLRPGNRKAFTDRAQVRDNRPPADLVERIKTPCFIMWGAEDTQVSPELAYEFHRRIQDSVLKIYQNTGHWPQEENPIVSVNDFKSFMKGEF